MKRNEGKTLEIAFRNFRVTLRQTFRPRDRPSYRDARTHLKRVKNKDLAAAESAMLIGSYLVMDPDWASSAAAATQSDPVSKRGIRIRTVKRRTERDSTTFLMVF